LILPRIDCLLSSFNRFTPERTSTPQTTPFPSPFKMSSDSDDDMPLARTNGRGKYCLFHFYVADELASQPKFHSRGVCLETLFTSPGIRTNEHLSLKFLRRTSRRTLTKLWIRLTPRHIMLRLVYQFEMGRSSMIRWMLMSLPLTVLRSAKPEQALPRLSTTMMKKARKT
jgi:hypothetical protein